MNLSILAVNYNNSEQTIELVDLIDSYAQDPMGKNEALTGSVREQLLLKFKTLPQAHSFICYDDRKPVGMINCFITFSTFQANTVLNIHDVYVSPEFRGLGLSKKLLKHAEKLARELNCCKMTLEVLSTNTIAQQSYIQAGFTNNNCDADSVFFWQKQLTQETSIKE